MSKVFRAWDVDQVWLFPASVQDFVPPGHMAHLIRETVREGLDLTAILAVRRGAGLSALPPGDDDGAAAVCLLPGDLLVAADRAGLRGAGRLHGGDGDAAAGLPDDQRVSPAASGGAERVCSCRCCGCASKAGLVKLGPRGARRHQDEGERLEAQGDELRPDEGGRGGARRRGRGMARSRRLRRTPAEDASTARTGAATSCPTGSPTKQRRLAKIREAKAALEAEAQAAARRPRRGRG